MSKSNDVLGVLGGITVGATVTGGVGFGLLLFDATSYGLGGTQIGDSTSAFGEASSTMANPTSQASADQPQIGATITLGGGSLSSLPSSTGDVTGSSTAERVGYIKDGSGDHKDIYRYNNLPYSAVEEKAKEIYDKLDGNHIPTVNGGATLVVQSPEAAEILSQIIAEQKPDTLLKGLEVMEKVYKKLPKRNG